MTSQELIEAILANIKFDEKNQATINQKEFAKTLSKVVDVPQIPVAFDFKELVGALQNLKPQDNESDVQKLVNALHDLRPESVRTPIKNISYDELDMIQLRMFQCMNSYGLDIGKSLYVETSSIKPKPKSFMISSAANQNIA